MKEKLNNLESKLQGRIDEVEKNTAENSKGVKRHSDQLECHSNELEHLTKKLRTEDHDKQKENYSEFADKKGIYL